MKVLFAGLGSIGQRHLRNLRALLGSSCEVLAYRALGRDSVLTPRMEVEVEAGLAARYGVREFADLDWALAERPEVVFVTNPTRFHIPVALAAARAGCHLFVEKPLSDGDSGVEELIGIVESKGLVASVGFQYRFHPGLLQIKSWLDEKRIGSPIFARLEVGEHIARWHPYEDYRESYAARRALGGGALVTQTHEFDYALWFFGFPARVFSLGGHLSDLDLDVEDVADVSLAFQVEGRLLPVHVHLDYLQWPPVRGALIVCERGKISWDFFANSVTLVEASGGRKEVHDYAEFDRNQLFVDELSHFLRCLRGEAKPRVSLREGAQSLRIALAARKSIETGMVINTN